MNELLFTDRKKYAKIAQKNKMRRFCKVEIPTIKANENNKIVVSFCSEVHLVTRIMVLLHFSAILLTLACFVINKSPKFF